MVSAEGERRRIARHIRRAEQFARRRDIRHLSREQKMIRALLLDELAAYRRHGCFPKNRSPIALRPTFVDEEGTRCAVAYMMQIGGAGALVRAVAASANHATVAELARDARLTEWLNAAGFTVEEAALIQPGYCTTTYSNQCVCRIFGSNGAAPGVLEGTVVRVSSGLMAAMRIDVVHGNAEGYSVGQEINVFAEKVGDTILVPVYAPSSSTSNVAYGIELPVQCAGLPLNKEQAIAVLESKDCDAALANVDSRWAQSACTKVQSGCDISSSDPSSVAIFCAVVGVVVTRQRLARRWLEV